MTERPGPMELYNQAHDEFPDDEDAARQRYHDLMVEHKHLVKRQPGESRNLPCGWPHEPG